MGLSLSAKGIITTQQRDTDDKESDDKLDDDGYNEVNNLRIAMVSKETAMTRRMRKKPRIDDEMISCLCTLRCRG